jgi:hypothetical protein
MKRLPTNPLIPAGDWQWLELRCFVQKFINAIDWVILSFVGKNLAV